MPARNYAGGHHEICVSRGKASFIAPDGVRRISARLAASAEFGKVDVFDAGVCERFAEIFRIEMWQTGSEPGKRRTSESS